MWTNDFWIETLRKPETFWAMLTAATTVALAWVAYKQLGDLARTGKSDFLYRLKKDFFTPETRQLVFLIENGLLEFRTGEIPYFEIVRTQGSADQRLNELGISQSTVSAYVVDDLLLGPLEDVGILLRRDMLSLDEVYEQFDSYAQLCAEDGAIGAYLKICREGEEDDDVYDGVEYLRAKLEEAGPKIRERKRRENRKGAL